MAAHVLARAAGLRDKVAVTVVSADSVEALTYGDLLAAVLWHRSGIVAGRMPARATRCCCG